MKRRDFLSWIPLSGGLMIHPFKDLFHLDEWVSNQNHEKEGDGFKADLVIAGGGVGGCAAALSALRNGFTVIMTEETDWIGGQLTQQGLSCPDEHPWIEYFGATQSYRDFRNRVRNYYKRNYPLSGGARSSRFLNPGNGTVSALCHEPRVSLAVLYELMAPYISSKTLTVLLNHKVIRADTEGDKVTSVWVKSLISNDTASLEAPYFIDATELGELLPLTGTEYITGAEAQRETKELHAVLNANPEDNQAFTHCFAMDYAEGHHIIDKPETYDFWKDYIPDMNPPWPGKLFDLSYSNPKDLEKKPLGFDPTGNPTGRMLNLWNYRRIVDPQNFQPGSYEGGITIVNWPQNDFFPGNLIDVSEEEFKSNIVRGKQLSLSLLYWLQTECPRPDGGTGFPRLRLRKDLMGTKDGLAKYPYIRESRRIKAVFTVLEEHVGAENRALITGKQSGNKAADFYDSVGVGYYHIDLHPSSAGRNYVDFGSLPFQIPLGALLPVRMKNLLPANKNIGTTHITNGCYRLHPVEWSIGESVGMLISFSLNKKKNPHEVREKEYLLDEFQNFIRAQGIETHWPKSFNLP